MPRYERFDAGDSCWVELATEFYATVTDILPRPMTDTPELRYNPVCGMSSLFDPFGAGFCLVEADKGDSE